MLHTGPVSARARTWAAAARYLDSFCAQRCLISVIFPCLLLALVPPLLPQGFTQIKVLRSGRTISCFVEFDTIENAALCHSTQQVCIQAGVGNGR